MNKIITRYTDPGTPGSFSGLSGFKKNTISKKKKLIESSLLKLKTFTLHRNKRVKYKRTQVIVAGIDDQWQIDLVDVRKIKGSNFGVSYIFTCIDVFSKNAWAKTIKTKQALECKNALEAIIRESKRKPNHVYLDGGNEFKGAFRNFCINEKILIFPTNSVLKASVVERFNRTLKEKMWRMFTFHASKKTQKPKNFTKYLKKLVNSYNNSFHRSIKTSPSKVNNKNENLIRKVLYQNEDSFIRFKFKIGDYARISIEKDLFEKGYTPNWSDEIYIISNLIPSNPPRYILKDLDNKIFGYKYYNEELQKVLFEEFPYDTFKVIKSNSKNLLLEKLNSNKHTTWIKKEILNENLK